MLYHRAELVNLEELNRHLSYIYHAPDTSKVSMISNVLAKMDFNKDGSVEVDHVLGVLNLMLDKNEGISPKLFEEVIEMMVKEEQLESAKLIQHALRTTIAESKLSDTTSASPVTETSSLDTYSDESVDDTTVGMPKESKENQELCNQDNSLESGEVTETEKQAKHSQ